MNRSPHGSRLAWTLCSLAAGLILGRWSMGDIEVRWVLFVDAVLLIACAWVIASPPEPRPDR